MTDEFTHPRIAAFEQLEEGDDWYEAHQLLIERLQTLLKHVDGSGERFTPPTLTTEEATVADSLSATRLTNEELGRDLWANEPVTIQVPDDVPTLSAAIGLIPTLPYDYVAIDVAPETDLSDDDLLITQLQTGAGRANDIDDRGFEHKIRITGDVDNPSSTPLGSIMIAGYYGGILRIEGFELQHNNPYKFVNGANDNSPATILHSNEIELSDIAYAGGDNGVLAYGNAYVMVKDLDFGDGVLSGNGIDVKHGGQVQVQRVGSGLTGTVGRYVYRPTRGIIWATPNSMATGEMGLIDPDARGGMVIEEDDSLQSEAAIISRYSQPVLRGAAPSGCRLTKNEAQTIPSDDEITLTWDGAEEFNDELENFADLSGDGVTVPNGSWSYAKATLGLQFDSSTEIHNIEIQTDGANVEGQGRLAPQGDLSPEILTIPSGWFAVSSGDTIRASVEQRTGSSVDVAAGSNTWLEVEFR